MRASLGGIRSNLSALSTKVNVRLWIMRSAMMLMAISLAATPGFTQPVAKAPVDAVRTVTFTLDPSALWLAASVAVFIGVVVSLVRARTRIATGTKLAIATLAVFMLLGINRDRLHFPSSSATEQESVANWETLTGRPTGQWTDERAFSVFADGEFDLSNVSELRITIDPSQAGRKFLLRLVPEGVDFNQPEGVRWEPITVPADGVVRLKLNPAEFGIDPTQMGKIVQMTALSGDNAWNRPIDGQKATEHVIFSKIEGAREQPAVEKPTQGSKGFDRTSILRTVANVPSTSESARVQQSWQTVAGRPTGDWTDNRAYSAYADGNFDLSQAKAIRITFDPSQAGTKFRLRLMPKDADPNQPDGVRWELIEIPADGIVILQLKAAEFGLDPAEMSNITQFAVLSGDNAWNRSTGQPASKRATFKSIAISFNSAPSSEPQATPAAPESAAGWEEIGAPTGEWTDDRAFSSFGDGDFDLSDARELRITFDPSQAGTKFFLRLVPKNANPDQPTGVRWKLIEIPADGVVILPFKGSEFGLGPKLLKEIGQIAILSGDNAWNRRTGQAATKHAVPTKFEVRRDRRAMIEAQALRVASAVRASVVAVKDVALVLVGVAALSAAAAAAVAAQTVTAPADVATAAAQLGAQGATVAHASWMLSIAGTLLLLLLALTWNIWSQLKDRQEEIAYVRKLLVTAGFSQAGGSVVDSLRAMMSVYQGRVSLSDESEARLAEERNRIGILTLLAAA